MVSKRALTIASSNTCKGKRSAMDKNVEVRKKVTFVQATFTTPKPTQRFNLHFANKTIIPSRNIDFSKLGNFQFDRLFTIMGWLPIVSVKEFLCPRDVKCFYYNMTFKVVQRLCDYQKAGRPTSHTLTMLSHILQHMISYIFIPKRGHRDDVSFFEAFLVYSILSERKINIGYIIFQHMKACSLSEDSILLYGMFITKIVKYFNVNLRNEIDDKKLKSFDTYDQASLRRMHFVLNKDGSWERKSSVPPSEVDVSSNDGSFDEENENEDVEGRGTENENAIEIPSNDGQE
ncbi:hypothetical protein PVL29_013801 [Vitis rotundifolia]|uniref:Uncharacterized protein n=1 Tax=Vitis rotundifolia TaxID=103349 RepID=A0AA38ZNY8_VITRO|nr:hypothetical protein PVL29_013801 [Vitis rotundifolia]